MKMPPLAWTPIGLSAVVCIMIGLTYAAVPLYQLFCQVTGFGGTPQRVAQASVPVLERKITVRFNGDVDRALSWRLTSPDPIELNVGEPARVFYHVHNQGTEPETGTATFNVTPLKSGSYFNKIVCFCFQEQRLKEGEEALMGVDFFIDPAIAEDRNLDDINTITLSYTFFKSLPEEELPQISHYKDGYTEKLLSSRAQYHR